MVHGAFEVAAHNPTALMTLAYDGLSKDKTKVTLLLSSFNKSFR